jgi:hypothetical protein
MALWDEDGNEPDWPVFPFKMDFFLILILSQLTETADSTVSWLREAQLKFQQTLFYTQSGE